MELENEEDYRLLGNAISLKDTNTRLDLFLAQKFLFNSRISWQKVIKDRAVLVNNIPQKASYRLKLGDIIKYYSPQSEEPEVNTNIEILWDDKDIIAVYKPPNLPMHESGAYRKNTFCELLKQNIGDSWYPVHRLDRETSGLVLCAKSTEVRNQLSEIIRTHQITKEYKAISFGQTSEKYWTVDKNIGLDPNSILRLKQAVIQTGQSAFTEFETLETKSDFSLLKVTPKTGRTHQIRVHASYSGLPLVGDKKYCKDEYVALEYLEKGFTQKVKSHCLVERLCLHAYRLTFIHPIKNKSCIIEAPFPEDLQEIWNSL